MMISENLKQKLENFLGKSADNVVQKSSTVDQNSQEVCDLDTGICYTVRSRDGLIERVEDTIRVNRKVQVESPSGEVKQLLNG
tara:strand:- start:1153 stop:1401 length:249 start_codon:yes stop_codon:yes gene_type:complete